MPQTSSEILEKNSEEKIAGENWEKEAIRKLKLDDGHNLVNIPGTSLKYSPTPMCSATVAGTFMDSEGSL